MDRQANKNIFTIAKDDNDSGDVDITFHGCESGSTCPFQLDPATGKNYMDCAIARFA